MKFLKNKKIQIACVLFSITLLIGGIIGWSRYASVTQVALVNFQPFQATSIAKSNLNPKVKYKEVSVNDLNKLSNYDFVLAFSSATSLKKP